MCETFPLLLSVCRFTYSSLHPQPSWRDLHVPCAGRWGQLVAFCTQRRGCRSLGCCSAAALGGMELPQSGISSETALQEVVCVPSPFQVVPGVCSQICFLTLVTPAMNPFPIAAQYPVVTQGWTCRLWEAPAAGWQVAVKVTDGSHATNGGSFS